MSTTQQPLVTVKQLAERYGITESALSSALPELPEPTMRAGRSRLWDADLLPVIDMIMRRRAGRRFNRTTPMQLTTA